MKQTDDFRKKRSLPVCLAHVFENLAFGEPGTGLFGNQVNERKDFEEREKKKETGRREPEVAESKR